MEESATMTVTRERVAATEGEARSMAPAAVEPPHLRAAANSVVLGTVCGLLAALGYTVANIGLRAVAHCDPAWVSCVKSFPTILVMAPWLVVLYFRGRSVMPSPRNVSLLVAAALVGQFGGNVAFQWSLGVIGLAFAVPLTTAAMIMTGAVLGRIVHHESLTRRTLVSMGLLIAATCVLSLGAGRVHEQLPALHARFADAPLLLTAAGVAAAFVSGIAYAILGVVIRSVVADRGPIASILFIVATVGVTAVGAYGYSRIGWQGIVATSSWDYGAMALAGICNTAAFVCLTVALRETSVTYVNNLSASQTAMASLLGIVLFHEPLSVSLMTGVALTVVGLMLMSRRKKKNNAEC